MPYSTSTFITHFFPKTPACLLSFLDILLLGGCVMEDLTVPMDLTRVIIVSRKGMVQTPVKSLLAGILVRMDQDVFKLSMSVTRLLNVLMGLTRVPSALSQIALLKHVLTSAWIPQMDPRVTANLDIL